MRTLLLWSMVLLVGCLPSGRREFQEVKYVDCEISTWYADSDDDGYGGEPVEACNRPAGVVNNDDDCNDDDPNIHPQATERCDNTDWNCDGDPKNGAPGTPFYLDDDDDGFGDVNEVINACEAPSGYVDNGNDCDDADKERHPDADETCNDVDDDCDGKDDEDAIDAETWYADSDGDGFGDPNAPISGCDVPGGVGGYSD